MRFTNFKFSTFIIWVLALQLIACTQKDEADDVLSEESSQPFVVYLVDEQDSLSQSYAQQLAQVFDYNKIPFQVIDFSTLNQSKGLPKETKVLMMNNTKRLDGRFIEKLVEFTARGGNLVFTNLNDDTRAGYLAGLKKDAPYNYDAQNKGIHFEDHLLPGAKGVKLYPLKGHFSLSKENFKPEIKVLATAADNKELPVLLEHQIGAGKVIHFNTFIEFEKQDRGLLFAAALRGLEGVPYPIANVSTIFIDDFPNPLYDIPLEPVKSEMGLNQADFVMDVWWTDMLKLSNRFSIPYSAYPCFNYDQVKSPPFVFHEWVLHQRMEKKKVLNSADWMMKQVNENNFELALHGYNHESLLADTWPSQEYMELSFQALRKKWKINQYGPMPTSYVAPSNDIDSTGLKALANAMPELRYMSTTYEGELVMGGNREFDIDPYEPRFFDFPRNTSGYTLNDFKWYNQQSLYLFSGIWSHFIHPDDVYQLPNADNQSVGNYSYRNEKSLNWKASKGEEKGMYYQFTDYLQKVKDTHSATRFMTVTDGARVVEDWRNTEYQFEHNGTLVNVSKRSNNKWSDRNFYWMLYVDKANEGKMQQLFDKAGYSSSKTALWAGTLYTVKTEKPELIFDRKHHFKGNHSNSLNALYAAAMEDYRQFIAPEPEPVYANVSEDEFDYQPEPITDSVAWYVSNENLAAANKMLIRDLMANTDVDTAAFSQLITYLGYDNKSGDIWPILENIYKNKSKAQALEYLEVYLSKEAYPSPAINEKWLGRQLEADCGDVLKIKEYLSLFYDVTYLPQIKEVIECWRSSGSHEAYAAFVKYLIDFEPEKLANELADKSPATHPHLCSQAEVITYAFADSGDLQRALLWAECSDIDIITQLQWWVDLEAYNKMQSVYEKHRVAYPNDDRAHAFVANAWYDIGEYERGALAANKMTEGSSKEDFKKRLNKDLYTFDHDQQKYLYVKAPKLLQTDTLRRLRKDLRYSDHNAIEATTNYVVDNFNQSVWDNMLTYHFRTKNHNRHSISITHSEVSDLSINDFDFNNVPHSLVGLRYRYQTQENTDKPFFFAQAGMEQADNGTQFVNFGLGISQSKGKVFKSAQYLFGPVKTGPAISREIYWGELTAYYETGATDFLQPSLAVVGSHYTTGAFEGALTGRLFFNLDREKKSRFSPFAEGFISAANTSQEDGNPFWIVDSRFYGGGGLAWTYGRDQNRKFYARLEAGAFYDTFTDNFVRATGNIAFPIRDFTWVSGQFELFNQARYYSNGFQISLTHYFRRKRQYFYRPREYDEE